jgi:hypothetical protein
VPDDVRAVSTAPPTNGAGTDVNPFGTRVPPADRGPRAEAAFDDVFADAVADGRARPVFEEGRFGAREGLMRAPSGPGPSRGVRT